MGEIILAGTIGVLLIHGTMGSVLKKNGKKVWPLINGTDSHYMETLVPISDTVQPSHMLFTYKRLENKLNQHFDVVEEFIYDWRENNLNHSNLLKNKIELMNVEEVHIVAHSMGGIIAKICINEHKDTEAIKKITKLITLGTPWKGSMESVKTLLYGSRVPEKYIKYIDKDTSREISKHFPSVYQLLPTRGFLSYLKEVDCVPYYFNDIYYDDFDDFFKGILQETFRESHDYKKVFEEYYQLLNDDLPLEIELHEIVGTGKPTIKVISENTRKEPYVSYDEGDGTVPLFSAYSRLHDRDNYHIYFVNKVSHVGMPSNINIVNLVKDIILEKEISPNSAIFESLESEYYKKFNGYISKVACPVDISIRDKNGNIVYGNIETIDEEQIKELFLTDYEVENIGTTTYVIFDEGNTTSISNFNGLVVDAYDKGLTSISLEKYEEGVLTEKKAFKTFYIDPHLQAEINFEGEIEKSSLKLTKDGNVEQTLQLDNVEVHDRNVEPPRTTIGFTGENFLEFKNEEIYFGKDLIKLRIEKIETGKFEPKETFVLINGKEYVVEDDINLDSTIMKHGSNTIEYFSIDEYDYSEKKRKLIFYYFHQITSKVEFSIQDKSYQVKIHEDLVYNRISDEYNLQRTQPVYNFSDASGVTGFHVVYRNITRTLDIKYVDIFRNEVNCNFTIDEPTLKKIIKGAATVKDVNNFVEQLNIHNPKYLFHLNKPGNHILLNDNNLNGSSSFEILSDTSKIRVIKNVELDVSFEALSEHINLTSDIERYTFVFKVLDIDQQYVDNLNLAGNILFTLKNEKEYKEELDVKYLRKGSYELNLELKTIKDILEGYWRPSDKVLTAKLEIINSKNNSVIRGLDLTIAK